MPEMSSRWRFNFMSLTRYRSRNSFSRRSISSSAGSSNSTSGDRGSCCSSQASSKTPTPGSCHGFFHGFFHGFSLVIQCFQWYVPWFSSTFEDGKSVGVFCGPEEVGQSKLQVGDSLVFSLVIVSLNHNPALVQNFFKSLIQNKSINLTQGEATWNPFKSTKTVKESR